MKDYTIPNLRNACRILNFLSTAEKWLTISEIADDLRIPRSTVLRILYTLQTQNFVRQQEKRYSLGPALIPLGNEAMKRVSPRETAIPILRKLTAYTKETSHLATLNADRAIILEVSDSPHPLSAHSRQGSMAELHCSATGKALLAFMDMEKRDLILQRLSLSKRTAYTLTNIADLKADLEKTRERGYSIDEQEYHEGIRCLAAPVFDTGQQVAFAIGITASKARFTRNKISSYAKRVCQSASELSSAIGG